MSTRPPAKPPIQTDEELFTSILPVVRSGVALLLKLRYGNVMSVKLCYGEADLFINQFKKDLTSNG